MFDYSEYEWKETSNGNHVCIESDDLVATVFNNGYGWQIIINGEGGISRIVAHVSFDEPEDAQERAEAVLRGAEADLVFIPPKDASTNWQTQKTVACGSPTYGRKYNGQGVSVKKAKSNKWFYHPHGSDVQGWFDSAEEAKQAFDAKHQ